MRDMGDGHVCRALARRLELRGGIIGATLAGCGLEAGISGIGHVGGGVGAEIESTFAIPCLTRVRFLCSLDRLRTGPTLTGGWT